MIRRRERGCVPLRVDRRYRARARSWRAPPADRTLALGGWRQECARSRGGSQSKRWHKAGAAVNRAAASAIPFYDDSWVASWRVGTGILYYLNDRFGLQLTVDIKYSGCYPIRRVLALSASNASMTSAIAGRCPFWLARTSSSRSGWLAPGALRLRPLT